MIGKTVLITGASSGFGLITTIELCRRGFEVIATMRDLTNKDTIIKLCQQNGVASPTHFLQLDVTNSNSIENLEINLKELPPIDILINNAGFALGGFAEEVSLQEYKEQFETNLFGVISVTQAVLPNMREQGEGKVINVSSISGKIAFPGLSAYVASKHALEGWTECLRLEVKPFGIDVALIEPGSFQTNIWTKGKRIAKNSLLTSSPYFSYMRTIENEMEKGESSYGEPQIVALLIAKLCSRKKIKKLRYPIGKGVRLLIFLKHFLPWIFWEKIVLKKLKQ